MPKSSMKLIKPLLFKSTSTHRAHAPSPLRLYLQRSAAIVICNIQVGYSINGTFNDELRSTS
jgi:hypothetical protein